MTSSATTHVNSGRHPHFYKIFMLRNYLVYFCTYVYLRVLNQYGTHWNKNTPYYRDDSHCRTTQLSQGPSFIHSWAISHISSSVCVI